MDDESSSAPRVYSIFKDNLLVAYARRDVPEGGEGAIRKASGNVPRILAPLSYGVVDCFDTKASTVIVAKGTAAASFDALLFALKLEGFDIHEGELKPDITRWRF